MMPDQPPGLVKEYPDGRRELIRFDHLGEHFVRTSGSADAANQRQIRFSR
jgi:hypothetical protein